MPIVQIQMLEGRDALQKSKVIFEMTETLSQVLNIPKQNIRIIIQEIPTLNWGVSGMPIEVYRDTLEK